MIDDDLIANLKWRLSALACALSRSVGIRPLYPPHFIIYTDASWKSSAQRGMIAAILIGRQSGRIVEVLSSDAPLRVVKLFDNYPANYGIELLALVAAFAAWQDKLAGAQAAAYVDYDPSPMA